MGDFDIAEAQDAYARRYWYNRGFSRARHESGPAGMVPEEVRRAGDEAETAWREGHARGLLSIAMPHQGGDEDGAGQLGPPGDFVALYTRSIVRRGSRAHSELLAAGWTEELSQVVTSIRKGDR